MLDILHMQNRRTTSYLKTRRTLSGHSKIRNLSDANQTFKFDRQNSNDINYLIDTILSNQEYKEFFHDLIINEDMIANRIEKNEYQPSFKGLKNIVIKSDWDDSDDEIHKSNTSLVSKRNRLHTSGGRRKFAQHLYPMFFKNTASGSSQRAATANTEVIRKRQVHKLNK